MGNKIILNTRGAVLFETFIAILVLSIGIAAVLRIFGESVWSLKTNQENIAIRQELEDILFPLFVAPL